MSVRQNKKRKAKSNRERTITALTIIEDIPSHLKLSPFSIADHDQVQPTAPLTFPFPVTSSSGSVVGNPVAASPQVVASPIYLHHPSVRYESFLTGMQHPQQAHFFPNPSLPPGQGDLEALERLKDTIKNNQHEIFRAVPRPAALASLYKGPLPSLALVPVHAEQIPNNSSEKPTTASSSPGFTGDAHHSYSSSAIQSATSTRDQGNVSAPSRSGIYSNMVSSTPVDSRDQNRPMTDGHTGMQSHPDDRHRPIAPSQLRSSAENALNDVNGGSTEPSRRDSASDMQSIPPQLLSSPERRRSGGDSDRPPAYASDRERLPSREVRPYERERDWEKEHEGDRMHERDRERERDRRWSLSDPRRPDSDRRPFDNDRRPSSDDRRLPSYDRRPPHVVDERRPLPNDDRRPSYLEDKRSPGFVDRRLPDDRHFADYERRPLSEENRFGTAQSQDPSQELHLGNERRLSATLASKTRVPAALPSSPAPSSGIVGTPATVSMASGPLDPTQGRVVTGERRPTLAGGSTSSMAFDSQRVSTSRYVVPLEERSNQLSSLPERVSSSTHPQLGQRSESMRPGILVEGRLSKPLENLSVTPASLGGSTNQAAEDLSRARVSEPSHAIDSRPGMNSDRERFSLSTADDRTRSVPAAYSHALSVGRDESRLQPPPPPPPHVSTPSGVSSAHSSLPLRAREPSRERPPPNFRPYFRSEFSRPTDDDRRLDVHSYPSGDGFRRYDERGRWSPPPYGDRRSYREFYDRDRTSWDSSSNKDRARDRPQPPPQLAPSHWERERERERARYPEPSYTTSGPERRFEDREQGNRERWYPSSYDDPSRRPPPPPPPAFDTFSPRGRPRSPGSPREHGELRPPPLKRARDDGYVTGEEYYSHRSSAPLNILSGKEPLPPPQPIPIPVPIPIPRPVSPPLLSQLPLPPQQQQAPLPPPPSSSSSSSRYNNHSRLPPVESYVGTYGGYERSGPGYVREGPR